MNNSPLKMVTCGRCFLSQPDTGQKVCKHGNHPFVLFVQSPLKGIPFSAKNQVSSPRQDDGSVNKQSGHAPDPVTVGRSFFGIS